MAEPNQRGHYRIEYPTPARPSLVTSERTLEVIDCSESGLRYVLPEADSQPGIGSEVRGVVHFRTGEEVEVEGVISRLYGRSVAVSFSGTQIPFSTILQEQHYLRRHYLLPPREGY
jgi:hypothetical protein